MIQYLERRIISGEIKAQEINLIAPNFNNPVLLKGLE